MLGLKLNHVSKRGHRRQPFIGTNNSVIVDPYAPLDLYELTHVTQWWAQWATHHGIVSLLARTINLISFNQPGVQAYNNKIDLVWMGPVVAELQYPQSAEQTVREMNKRRDATNSIVSPFPLKIVGQKSKKFLSYNVFKPRFKLKMPEKKSRFKVLLQWNSTSVYTSCTYSTYLLGLALGTFMCHFTSACLVCHTS